MPKFLQVIPGDKYGKLTIVEQTDRHIYPDGKRRRKFICRCDCGKSHTANLGDLRSGSVTSCGCAVTERLKIYNYRHGKRYTSIYKIWDGIKARCANKNHIAFARYGGRGIKYDTKWKTFEGFFEDMGQSYEDGLTIERVNNDGNYSKDNCKWATTKEQSRNKSSNRILYGKCLMDWSIELGIPYSTLQSRIARRRSTDKVLSS